MDLSELMMAGKTEFIMHNRVVFFDLRSAPAHKHPSWHRWTLDEYQPNPGNHI
jgi:hypothetical protein